MNAAMFVVVVFIGYLLGSIPFGLLISRSSTGTDLRQVGSGKTGMTNVLRTSGKKAAAMALVLDMAKGALAVLLAWLIFRGAPAWMRSAQVAGALAAIAGHNWSVFLKFKGGRGVATFLGGLVAMFWPAAVIGGGIMLIIGFRTKYMSLGSIIGVVFSFILLAVLCVLDINIWASYPAIEYVLYAMICAIFIFVQHRDNVTRLVNGRERQLGERVETENLPSPGNHK
jgi:glycerol-3-phosphate acyltransferase PlsY